jgi:hypothetical protein
MPAIVFGNSLDRLRGASTSSQNWIGARRGHHNVSSHAGFIAGFTAIAENIVRRQLGRDSQRRY